MLDRELFGIVGVVRVVEVTHGRNGWHPHVHALVFARDLDDQSLGLLLSRMFDRWAAGAVRKGLAAPLARASDAQMVTGADLSGTALGDYLAKGADAARGIGLELTQTASKVAQATHSTRPVWAILEDAQHGEADPLWLWHEWERASKGKRQISWSAGLRDLLGIGHEAADEDIAAEELGERDDTVVWITRQGWDSLVRRPWLISEVLDQAERLSPSGFSDWLTDQGVEHRRA
jgi:hypothetical protein